MITISDPNVQSSYYIIFVLTPFTDMKGSVWMETVLKEDGIRCNKRVFRTMVLIYWMVNQNTLRTCEGKKGFFL